MILKEGYPKGVVPQSREWQMEPEQVLNLLGNPKQVAHAISGYKKPKTYDTAPDAKLFI